MRRILGKGMLCAGLVGTLLVGCQTEDLYNPEKTVQQYEDAWENTFGEIDPQQTWNLAKQVTADIELNEDALTEYTLKLYSDNPLYSEQAFLMAQAQVATDAQGKANATIRFDAPSYLQDLYVARVDKHNRRVVKSSHISGNTADVTFGTVKASTKAMELGDLPTMECPYTEEEVNKLIEEGYDLKNGVRFSLWSQNVDRICDIQRIDNNTNHSLTAVVSTEIDDLLNLESNGYTKVEGSSKSEGEWITPIPEVGTLKLVIAEGGVYSIDQKNKIENLDIIVAHGGTLCLKSELQMNKNARIIVMPGGKIVDENNATINHDAETALIYNNGTIDVNTVRINFATFYNAPNGIMEMEEISLQNRNGDCILTNWGRIDVDRIVGNGNQGTINNGCLLRSKEKIQVLCINQAPNTAIECEFIDFQDLTLRENSILRANNLRTNLTHIQFVGTGAPALISTQNVEYVNVGSFEISGNIYMEVNTYSDNLEGNEYGGYWKTITNAIVNARGLSKVGEAPVSIPGSENGDECTGKGNTPSADPDVKPDTPQSWLLACEDLGAIDDFDFNDIVFSVSHVEGSNQVVITPLAAGGTLAAEITYNGQSYGEIHSLLGVSTTTFANTVSGITQTAQPITINVDENFSITQNMGGFSVKVTDEEGNVTTEITAPGQGKVPQMICVPGTWLWPTERTNISAAYPGFGEWGANYGTNNDWCNNPVDAKVIRR